MKKKNNWLKDNRGAALVSIMIAVAFISILASAILYMSYSNFQMKVVNYQSKVNFYGTEKDMTVVSTGIQSAVVASQTPIDTLRTVAKVETVNGVLRYNPSALADLVYPDEVTPPATPANASFTVGDTKVSFSTNVADGIANYEVAEDTPTAGVNTITLKGVVITHENLKDGTTHKITTDLRYQIKQTETDTNPGGIGEFSVLVDSPLKVAPNEGSVTRATMYGNVFIGPGTYNQDKDAMTLTGESLFTQKGDYMIVYGNIRLQDKSVMSIVSGKLTVIGNIYIEDDAALLCAGEIYFPAGYGFVFQEGGKKANVIPQDLVKDENPTVKELDADSLDKLNTLLNLKDADTTNDGILYRILDPTLRQVLASGDVADASKTTDINYYGVNYCTRFEKDGELNGAQNSGERGDIGNSLVFNINGNAKMQDGMNLNCTIISLTPVEITNQKNTILSQVGSEVFDILTATSGEYYSDSTHKINVRALNGDPEWQNGSGKSFMVGSFFIQGDGTEANPSANEIVNQMLTLGGGGTVSNQQTFAAVGYVNWVKE